MGNIPDKAERSGVAPWLARLADCFADHEYELVAELACAGIRRFPPVARLWELRGLACWMLGQRPAALAALERASLLSPLHPFSRCALGDLYHRSGNAEAADATFAFLAEQEQSAALLAAVESDRLGDAELSLQVCSTLTEYQPANHRAYFGMACSLRDLGESPEAALVPLAVAMDLAPEVVLYRLRVAAFWAERGEWQAAAELLRPVAAVDVECPEWLAWMRTVFDRVGDTRRAGECLGRLRGQGP